jgi:hypothetical protein
MDRMSTIVVKPTHKEQCVTPTFYKNNFFCPHRSAYQIVVHMKNFPKINLV